MKDEYDFENMRRAPHPMHGKVREERVKIPHEAIDYFKQLSKETSIPYHKLIEYYLLDCAKKKRELNIEWDDAA